jgi:hypothetical protein
MAKDAAKPDQQPQAVSGQEAKVESGEDQLAGLLAKIRESLGLGTTEIKLEKAFSMSGEGHTLYFAAKRPEIPKVVMATGRRDYLETMATGALVREEEGAKRPGLISPLQQIVDTLKTIKFDWEANFGKSEEEAKARQNYLNTLERCAVVLQGLGAEFGLKDLENLGHPSKYAQRESIGGPPVLMPQYRGGSNIRKTLYGGGYRDSTLTWKAGRLSTLKQNAPSGFFIDEMTKQPEPINVSGLPTNVTIDHIYHVVTHWNDRGHNQVQGDRLDFFNEESNMRLVAWKNNSTDGALTEDKYQEEVGPIFRGPNDNP